MHTSGEGATSVGLIYLRLVGNGWSSFLREISPAFDVVQPLFRVTAEKKDTELNPTLSHIVFSLTYLLLNTASIRKVHWLQSPHWAKYRELFQSSPCPETCVICQEIQQLGGIVSLSSPLCVPSFTSMRQKDSRINSKNKRRTRVTLAPLKGLIDIV